MLIDPPVQRLMTLPSYHAQPTLDSDQQRPQQLEVSRACEKQALLTARHCYDPEAAMPIYHMGTPTYKSFLQYILQPPGETSI